MDIKLKDAFRLVLQATEREIDTMAMYAEEEETDELAKALNTVRDHYVEQILSENKA